MKDLLQESLFTNTDYTIVRSAVRRLPGLLAIVIEMRFWQQRTFSEIAMELGVSVNSIESVLPQAMRLLREECLRNPAFSRSKHDAIQCLRSKSVA